MTPMHIILPGKSRKPISKVTPLPSTDTYPTAHRKKATVRVVLGNIVLSREAELLAKSGTLGLAASVVGVFVLQPHVTEFADFTDKVNLALVSFFIFRFSLVTLVTGLKLINLWTIIDTIIGFWAATATLLAMGTKNTSYDSFYFPLFSRLCTATFAFRLTYRMGAPKLQGKKLHPSNSHKIELVSDKAQEILQRVLEEPWLHCKTALFEDVAWCLDAIASDRLNQTIVVVDNSEQEQQVQEKDLIDIVNRFSQADHSAPSVVLQRKSSEYQIAGLPSSIPPDLTDEIRLCLKQVDSMKFDVFQLKDATNNNELFTVANLLCKRGHLLATLGISITRFSKYTSVIQDGYNSSVLYHNATHATDVIQTFHYFVYYCEMGEILNLSALEVFAGYVAAMVHDFEHPGVTNSFLVSTQAEWAITYNDKSVLENHHVSAAFAATASQDCNIYSDLSPEHYSHLRATIIAMVLATDPANHFALLSHFKAKFTAFGISHSKEDRQLSLEVMLHAADISNPTKPWELCQKWAELILNEFWLQGDRERKLGISLSYLTDRKTVNVPKSQIGFIDVIVEPLFAALRDVFPAIEELCEKSTVNREKWGELATECSNSTFVRNQSLHE